MILVSLPRCGRQPASHEGGVGGCHGQAQTARVHERVEGGDGPARPGQGESIGPMAQDLHLTETALRERVPQVEVDIGRSREVDDRGAGGTGGPPAGGLDVDGGAQHSTLQVSHAGVYAWRARPSVPRAQMDHRLRARDRGDPRRERAGRRTSAHSRRAAARRVPEQPKGRRASDVGPPIGGEPPPTVSRDHLLAVPVSRGGQHVARQFDRPQPNHAWVTDITYISTAEGGPYLAPIFDLYASFLACCRAYDRVPLLVLCPAQ